MSRKKILIEISEECDQVSINGKVVAKGDLDVSVYDFRGQEKDPPVKLELWYEPNDGPQIRTHFTSGMNFTDVHKQMIALRDKLTEEIGKGPECCPFSSLRDDT